MINQIGNNFSIGSVLLGVAQLVYYNVLTAEERTYFNQSPARTANGILPDFELLYFGWITQSYQSVSSAISNVKFDGNFDLSDTFFIASLFADTSTQQLLTACWLCDVGR